MDARVAAASRMFPLVGQDYRRVVDQGPGDGHPLHLSAGHLVALVPQAVAQSHGL